MRIGRRLAGKLNSAVCRVQPFTPSDFETLCRTLRPGDVLLIEGRERVSNAIKYLTQSTWSHAAMYVGDRFPAAGTRAKSRTGWSRSILGEGCVSAPLRANTRATTPASAVRSGFRRTSAVR